jgi:hypothetical protein
LGHLEVRDAAFREKLMKKKVNFIRPPSIDAERMLHVIVKVHGRMP